MKKIEKAIYYAAMIIVIILISSMIVAIEQSVFSNHKVDTTFVTNIGFVMLLAFGNVCFSWSRSINPERIYKINKINKAGLECLVASILFLIGSLCKYTLLNYDKLSNGAGTLDFIGSTLFLTLIKVLLTLSFFYAMFLTFGAIIVILHYYFVEET